MKVNGKRRAIHYTDYTKSRLIAGDMDRIMRGELDEVVLVLHGTEIVLYPDKVYYDDDTSSIKGVTCFLNDTSGG
jgi:hypothetical protein